MRVALAGLADPEIDIATLAAVIEDDAALADTSVNKVVAGFADPGRPARALYFSKAVVPWGDGPHYEHIGLYAYRRAALERFVGLPRGVLEQRERLEQLRALEAGMRISVSLIEAGRLGVQVDTPADLERARQLMQQMADETRMTETEARIRRPGSGRFRSRGCFGAYSDLACRRVFPEMDNLALRPVRGCLCRGARRPGRGWR